jgi:2-aminomuconate deaminase
MMPRDNRPEEEEDGYEIVEEIADIGEGALAKGAEILGTAAGLAVGGPVGAVVGGVAGKKAFRKVMGDDGPFITEEGPSAVGAYPHLYKSGGLLFVSGMGPRTPDTNEIPGGPIRDSEGNALDYDIRAQTHSVINNVSVILEAHGSSLEDVVDILVFLVDMDRDFPGYNEVYAQYFSEILPARTTVSVNALPTDIAIELKVVAKA